MYFIFNTILFDNYIFKPWNYYTGFSNEMKKVPKTKSKAKGVTKLKNQKKHIVTE